MQSNSNMYGLIGILVTFLVGAFAGWGLTTLVAGPIDRWRQARAHRPQSEISAATRKDAALMLEDEKSRRQS